MAIIKKFSSFLIAAVLFISFSQCKSQDIQKEDPFTITEKTYFYWVGGRKGSSGTKIKIVGNGNTSNLEFTTIYFHDKEYKITSQFDVNQFTLIGSNTRSSLNDKNIIMDGDSKKEFGNKPPKPDKEIPFELKDNEAIIVYTIDGENLYYKISGVKKLKTIYYP